MLRRGGNFRELKVQCRVCFVSANIGGLEYTSSPPMLRDTKQWDDAGDSFQPHRLSPPSCPAAAAGGANGSGRYAMLTAWHAFEKRSESSASRANLNSRMSLK